MSKTERKKYQAALESKEAELAARLGNRDCIAIEKTTDALDEVQYAGERELAIRGFQRESTLLRMVRAALARLAAAPWSTCCLKCQEAAGRREFEVMDVPDSFIADAA